MSAGQLNNILNCEESLKLWSGCNEHISFCLLNRMNLKVVLRWCRRNVSTLTTWSSLWPHPAKPQLQTFMWTEKHWQRKDQGPCRKFGNKWLVLSFIIGIWLYISRSILEFSLISSSTAVTVQLWESVTSKHIEHCVQFHEMNARVICTGGNMWWPHWHCKGPDDSSQHWPFYHL